MSSEELSRGMTLESVLRMLRKVGRFWPWVAALAILAAPLGAYYGIKTYQERYYLNVVMVVGGREPVSENQQAYTGIDELVTLAQTYASAMQTDQFYSAISRSLTFPIQDWMLKDVISVEVPKGTSLIKIGIVYDTAKHVQEIEAAVQSYVNYQLVSVWSERRISWIEGYTEPQKLNSLGFAQSVALYSVAAAVVGAFFGALVALVCSFFDKRVWDLEECMQSTGLSVMGALEKDGSTDDAEGSMRRIERLLAASTQSKRSMRILAAALHVRLSMPGDCVAIVEPSEFCGVHKVAANLSEAFSRQGKKVLLVDMESQVRRHKRTYYRTRQKVVEPSVLQAARDEIEREVKSEIASGAAQPAWTISKAKRASDSEFDYLVFDKSFERQSPAQRLATTNYAIAALRSNYDLIVLTVPPVLKNDDALLALTAAQETLPVFRYKKTTMQEVEQTLRCLRSIGAAPAGCVWTFLEKRLMRRLY